MTSTPWMSKRHIAPRSKRTPSNMEPARLMKRPSVMALT